MVFVAFDALLHTIEVPLNFKYGAWGEVVGGNTSADATPFGFTGRLGSYTDVRVGQVLNWNRWLGPSTGRWGSRDPIGIMGGSNLYVSSSNNVPNLVDPSGNDVVLAPAILLGALSILAIEWAAMTPAQREAQVRSGMTLAKYIGERIGALLRRETRPQVDPGSCDPIFKELVKAANDYKPPDNGDCRKNIDDFIDNLIKKGREKMVGGVEPYKFAVYTGVLNGLRLALQQAICGR